VCGLIPRGANRHRAVVCSRCPIIYVFRPIPEQGGTRITVGIGTKKEMQVAVVRGYACVSHARPVGVIKAVAGMNDHPFEAVRAGTAPVHFGHSQILRAPSRRDREIHLLALICSIIRRCAINSVRQQNADIDAVKRTAASPQIADLKLVVRFDKGTFPSPMLYS